jgi:cyclic pyranopterin phosphate synthase
VALREGFHPLKINVVVMGGINEDEILDFVELTRALPLHIRFIEYMPFTSNGWEDSSFVPYATMKTVIEERHALIPVGPPDVGGKVSKDFQVPGFEGKVGFITSISDHFCSTCSRLRILADGRIKNCLFQPPAGNVRDVIRAGGSDADLLREVREVLYHKPESHSPVRELVNLDSNEMVMIGG